MSLSSFHLRISLGVALGLTLILSPLGAKADGRVLRTKQTQGPFIVTIFTAPEVSRDIPTDVTLMIQRRDSGEVVLDAAVDLTVVPPVGAKISPDYVFCSPRNSLPSPEPAFTPGQSSIRAPRAQAANRLFYGTFVVLPATGNWQLQATIRQGGEEASVTCILPVGIPPHRLRGIWLCLALPPAAIALFAINQWLGRRGVKSVRGGFERRSPKTAGFIMRNSAVEGSTARDVPGSGQGRIAKLRHAQGDALAIHLRNK